MLYRILMMGLLFISSSIHANGLPDETLLAKSVPSVSRAFYDLQAMNNQWQQNMLIGTVYIDVSLDMGPRKKVEIKQDEFSMNFQQSLDLVEMNELISNIENNNWDAALPHLETLLNQTYKSYIQSPTGFTAFIYSHLLALLGAASLKSTDISVPQEKLDLLNADIQLIWQGLLQPLNNKVFKKHPTYFS
ncbi:MAG: hypothetical protein R2877_02375 [Bdellovibrionota bacterium]